MKPISKDEEFIHITSAKSRGECYLLHKYIVAVDSIVLLQVLLNKFQFQMKMMITIVSCMIMDMLDLWVLIKREMHQFETPSSWQTTTSRNERDGVPRVLCNICDI